MGYVCVMCGIFVIRVCMCVCVEHARSVRIPTRYNVRACVYVCVCMCYVRYMCVCVEHVRSVRVPARYNVRVGINACVLARV